MGTQSRRRRERREAKEKDGVRDERTIGHWAVAFLDLLGYGEALDAFDVEDFPDRGPEMDAFMKRVVRPRNFQRRLLGGIKTFIEGKRDAPTADLSRFPLQAQRLAATWRVEQINVGILGDAVTMDMALAPDERHFPARALDTMLSAACWASLIQLSVGQNDPEDTLPLRGGIDVGVGAVMEGQLYSAALKKAVVLERTAKVPRILVGDRLRKYVDEMAESQGTDMTTEYIRGLMAGAKRFFFRDPTDDAWCLDFLGEWVRERMPTAAPFIRPAHVFVQKALSLHTDDYVLAKYRWLDTYIKSRLSIWDLG